MQELERVAPAFVDMAHSIVWCSVATVDTSNRPRSRILHPVWIWDDITMTGWIGTSPTAIKRAHLEHSSFVSCNYWSPNHDTCTAECRATRHFDDETCTRIWEMIKASPEPLGFDPGMVPQWSDGPTSDAFAVLRLDPWRLRVFPGSVLMGQGGELLEWQVEDA